MTYEQSLKNVEIVKNFASPLEGYFLYFHFKNDTDFGLLFITDDYTSDEFKNYENIKMDTNRAGLPFVCIDYDKNFNLGIQYDDINLLYEENLTQGVLIDHSLKELPRNSIGMKESFLELVKLLKNK